jgi:hypothetical protein
MSVTLWKTGTSNAFQTTLNGSIGAADATIALTTTTGLVAPGILVLDRQNSLGEDTPTTREFISYTGISSNNITGCSRGVAGSTAQSHNSGALVEETFTTTHWGDLVDFLQVSHNSSGNIAVTGTASIATLRVHSFLNASGASISGRFPITPVWVLPNFCSGPSTAIGKPLDMPQAGEIQWTSIVLAAPASATSLFFDINKNGTSIFAVGNRMSIPAGGTYVSTASLATKTFVAGDVFTVDLDTGGAYQDATVKFRAI